MAFSSAWRRSISNSSGFSFAIPRNEVVVRFVWTISLIDPAALNQTEQNLVTLRLQLLDGAGSGLGVDAVDKLLLHLRRQHRRAESLPKTGHRAGELLEEVLDAAWAAAEVIEHHVAHDAPSQPRPPGQSGVDIGGAQHILGNEVIDLARQRGLQTIGDV